MIIIISDIVKTGAGGPDAGNTVAAERLWLAVCQVRTGAFLLPVSGDSLSGQFSGKGHMRQCQPQNLC